MIRYVSAIILICAFAVQSFNGVFIVLSYYANTAAYSKDCVNKFMPQLHCQGKCVMMKKMIEAEKKDQQSPVPKLEIKNDVFTADNLIASFTAFPIIGKINFSPKQSSKSSTGYLRRIFHPPSVC